MACPFFDPVEPRIPLPLGGAFPPPLGDPWIGRCLAAGAGARPAPAACHPACNFGYARGTCPDFPADAPADAVRFAIGGDDGVFVRIRYAVERNHYPFAHGDLDYELAAARFTAVPADPVLERQALAYLAGYRRRIREPQPR